MYFSDETIARAWNRTRGRCECRKRTHNHPYIRCSNALTWYNRGRPGRGAWEAHHIRKTGGDGLFNCEILCWDCRSQTL